MNLYQHADAVRSREDFLEFLTRLRQDGIENPHEWENGSIAEYLNAIGDWLGASDYVPQVRDGMVPDQPSWSDLAHILHAGKHYE